MNKNAKIYVAGHRGLVGSAILRKLQASGYGNVIHRTHSQLDLTRQQDVEGFFREEKPEYVFLAAARVGGIWANNNYPAQFIYENLVIQSHVIHCAYLSGVKRLLFLGSSCIYPKECPQPIKEDYLLSGYLEPTNEPYAVAKIAGIKMCQSYNRQHGTEFLCAMPTNLYGPNDNYDLENSHVLPALIRKCHLAKLALSGDSEAIARDENLHGKIPEDLMKGLTNSAGPVVHLWGSGAPRRELLHVDDLSDACHFLLNLEEDIYTELIREKSGIINIGVGEDILIKDLAEMTANLVGTQAKTYWDTTKPDGTVRKLLDSSRLSSLGWKPKISLRQGIQSTYEDYIKKTAGLIK